MMLKFQELRQALSIYRCFKHAIFEGKFLKLMTLGDGVEFGLNSYQTFNLLIITR